MTYSSGPKEPSADVFSSVVKPIVDELEQLYKGVPMDFLTGDPVLVNAALIMFSGDNPATSKALGFSSNNASSACTKCSEIWPSVFSRRPWVATYDLAEKYKTKNRSNHIRWGQRWLLAGNFTERAEIVSTRGYRYTSFTSAKLPYFNPGLHHAVDSMHCLLLGLCKALFVQCSKMGIFNQKKFEIMQNLCDTMKLPREMDGIRLKIDSQMKSLKAAQVLKCVVFRN
jgi:hypothetical protein